MSNVLRSIGSQIGRNIKSVVGLYCNFNTLSCPNEQRTGRVQKSASSSSAYSHLWNLLFICEILYFSTVVNSICCSLYLEISWLCSHLTPNEFDFTKFTLSLFVVSRQLIS